MKRALKFLAALAFVLIFNVHHLIAQEEQILPGSYGKGPLNAVMSGSNVVLSWPTQPGNWKLFAQQPANSGEWKPVTSEYHTNAGTVSVTFAVPQQTTLYRVARSITRRKMTIPTMPPLPTRSTNSPIKRPPP